MLKLKNKVTFLLLIIFCLISMGSFAYAATPASCPDGYDFMIPSGVTDQDEYIRDQCVNHQVNNAQSDSDEPVNFEADCKEDVLTSQNCGIVAYVVMFTRLLSGLVGIVVVIMIAVGGIQYATARDDPQAVSAARTRIRNAVLALVFYLVGIAFLQWLVPGGVF